jgi:CO dehydrogenase/acetyl-CoA synthase epsilon subunit
MSLSWVLLLATNIKISLTSSSMETVVTLGEETYHAQTTYDTLSHLCNWKGIYIKTYLPHSTSSSKNLKNYKMKNHEKYLTE